MARTLTTLFITALFLLGCVEGTVTPEEEVVLPEPTQETVSFNEDVRPILETKCLACHGCFDAACQLKLGSAEYNWVLSSELVDHIPLTCCKAL